MTSLSIPYISSCFQVKTSWFSLRKVVIFVFSVAKNVDPIFNTLDGSLGMTSTSCGTSDNLEIGSGSSIIHEWFVPDARVSWWHSLARTWSPLISPMLWAMRKWMVEAFPCSASSIGKLADRWCLMSFHCLPALDECWILPFWPLSPTNHYGVVWCRGHPFWKRRCPIHFI